MVGGQVSTSCNMNMLAVGWYDQNLNLHRLQPPTSLACRAARRPRVWTCSGTAPAGA